MASAAASLPTDTDPLPGDPSQAPSLAAFSGGSSPTGSQPPQVSPDLQGELQNATVQMRDAHRQLDSVQQTIQGLVEKFQPKGPLPSKIAQQLASLKKDVTSLVMDVVNQAQQGQGPQPGPTPMR